MSRNLTIALMSIILAGSAFWLGGYLSSKSSDDRLIGLLVEDYCQKVEVESSQLPGRSEQIREKLEDMRKGKLDCESVSYGGIRDRLYLISSHLYGVEMLSRSLQTVSKKNAIPPFRMVSADIDSALVSVLEQKCRYKSKDVELWDVLIGKSLLQAKKSLGEAKQACLDNGYVPLKQRQLSSTKDTK